MKTFQMFQVTLPCPYIVKEADDLETLYTASCILVLPMFSYDDPGLNMTIFMTGSNLFPNASAWV